MMRVDTTQPHYAPSSVGALMDPAFLRSARHDADGLPPLSQEESPPLWTRLQGAVNSVVAALRRH